MTDTKMHPGVRQSWKSHWDPKTVGNSPRNGSESTKTASVDERHVNASWGSTTMEIASGSKMVSNSPQNGSKSAKTSSVDDRHENAPRGSSVVEITLGPQNGGYIKRT